jgi:protein-histidine pros-kinase
VLASAAPVGNPTGAPRAYVTTLKDITDRKRVEQALAEHAAQLERANRELAEADQFKADLMAMLTHEINQLLTAIRGYRELLSREWPPRDDARGRGYLRQVGEAADRLAELVADLLLMFRIDAQAVTAIRTPVDLAEAVD